jgi:hypothetical protein
MAIKWHDFCKFCITVMHDQPLPVARAAGAVAPVRVMARPFPDIPAVFPMQPLDAHEFVIVGMTRQGRQFRPSDWSERLAGVMSQFRPGGPQPGSHLAYSPWCHPVVRNGIKCVVVHHDLRAHDVMAWDFCVNFARDNQLQVEGSTEHQPRGGAL